MPVLNRKQIVRMVVPLFIEQAFVVLLSVVSTFLSSQVSEQAVSAVSVMDGLNQLLMQLFIGISMGATVIMSQYSGQREYQKANHCIPQVMTSMVAVSTGLSVLILTLSGPITGMLLSGAEPAVLENGRIYIMCAAMSYPLFGVYSATAGIMRGMGNTRISMKIAIAMNIANAGVSSLLVFGFGMGVWGIGLGVVSSRVVAFAVCVWVLRNQNGHKRRLRELIAKPDWVIQRMLFKIGIPVSVEGMLFQLGRFMTQIYIIPMGTAYLSSYAVSMSITAVYIMPGDALRIAGITLIGMYIGAGDKKGAQRAMGMLMIIISLIMLLMSIPAFIFSDSIAGLYGLSERSTAIASECMRLYYIISPFFWAMSFVPASTFKAAGDIRYSTIVAIASVFLVRVTMGYIFGVVLDMRNLGVFIGMFADWIARGIFFMIRYFKKTWIKGVVVE